MILGAKENIAKGQIDEKTKNQKTKREGKINGQLTKRSPESCYQEYRCKKSNKKRQKTKQKAHLNHLILAAKYHIAASFLLQNLLIDVCWTGPETLNIGLKFAAIVRFADFLPSPVPGTISKFS